LLKLSALEIKIIRLEIQISSLIILISSADNLGLFYLFVSQFVVKRAFRWGRLLGWEIACQYFSLLFEHLLPALLFRILRGERAPFRFQEKVENRLLMLSY